MSGVFLNMTRLRLGFKGLGFTGLGFNVGKRGNENGGRDRERGKETERERERDLRCVVCLGWGVW